MQTTCKSLIHKFSTGLSHNTWRNRRDMADTLNCFRSNLSCKRSGSFLTVGSIEMHKKRISLYCDRCRTDKTSRILSRSRLRQQSIGLHSPISRRHSARPFQQGNLNSYLMKSKPNIERDTGGIFHFGHRNILCFHTSGDIWSRIKLGREDTQCNSLDCFGNLSTNGCKVCRHCHLLRDSSLRRIGSCKDQPLKCNFVCKTDRWNSCT